MIPDKIHYTDLEIDPQAVLNPRKLTNAIIPDDWTRHRFILDHEHGGKPIRLLDQWIEGNIYGRWASYSVYASDGIHIIVWFEHLNDAVMFKLKGGETEWLSSE